MIKKVLFGCLFLFLTSCIAEEPYSSCPFVIIRRDDAHLIQKANYQDDFDVELKGFEGYCYFDERVRREKARIIPIFVVSKLRNTDETNVQFSWFTQTIKGPPEYIGKNTYFADVHIKQGEKSVEVKGKEIELKVPNEMMNDFPIFMGLSLSRQERDYNQRLFDVDYGYYNENEIPEPNNIKLKVYPDRVYEDGRPAEVEYIDPNAKPKSSGCGSCSL